MPDIGNAAELLKATAELHQVKAIRRAVRSNLVAAGGVEGPLGTVTKPRSMGSQVRTDPQETIEQRRVIHPTPVYAPRLVVQSRPVVESAPMVPPAESAFESHLDHPNAGPLVPPWRMPLPEACSKPIVIIKSPPPPPDVINKGSLIDFFM